MINFYQKIIDCKPQSCFASTLMETGKERKACVSIIYNILEKECIFLF